MKRCTKCGETKPVSYFHKMASSGSGYHPRCKRCRSQSMGFRRTRSVQLAESLGDADIVWLESNGWRPTMPTEWGGTGKNAGHTPPVFTAWQKPGVGYVWSVGASVVNRAVTWECATGAEYDEATRTARLSGYRAGFRRLETAVEALRQRAAA